MSAADAALAARLIADQASGLGGVLLRARAGPARDRWLANLAALLPAAPRRLPGTLDSDRLTGGLDPVATLAAGRPVVRPGLLTGGGVLVLAMAERLDPAAAVPLAAALDGEAPPTLVVLDEGIDDERAPLALADRLAIHLDLDTPDPSADRSEARPVTEDAALAALAEAAAALGVTSPRATLFALRVARAAAMLAGRATLDAADLAAAARLVLAPRATRAPPDADADAEPPAPPAPGDGEGETERDPATPPTDVVLDAARAALPPDLLASLVESRATRASSASGAGGGALRKSLARGRPLAARRGIPRHGARLALIDTLRAAAAWQPLRRRAQPDTGRILIHTGDLHIRRFEERARSTTILVVDASGSAALERLAEAKGAALLLLADAYVRRAEVAVIAFRGTTAQLLLPPTRSLARAKRMLADLAGGGGTPLAAGINAATRLALAERARGRTPRVILLSDARANVTLDGTAGRAEAEAEAMAAARALRRQSIPAAVLDTAQRPAGHAARVAAAMGAHHAPLPRVEAGAIRALARALD